MAVESADKPDRDRVIAGYTLTNKLFKSNTEKSDRVTLARRQAALNVWLEKIVAIIGLNSAKHQDHSVTVFDGPFRLVARGSLEETGHKESEVREGQCLKFVVLVSGSETMCLLH